MNGFLVAFSVNIREYQRDFLVLAGRDASAKTPGIPGQPQSDLGLFMGLGYGVLSNRISELNTLQLGNGAVDINFMF